MKAMNKDIPPERIMLYVVQSFDKTVDENHRLRAVAKAAKELKEQLAKMTIRCNQLKTELGNTVKKLKKHAQYNKALSKQNEILGEEVANLRREIREMYDAQAPDTHSSGGWSAVKDLAKQIFRV